MKTYILTSGDISAPLVICVAHVSARQGWAIPGFGQQYYTLYYTGQKYVKTIQYSIPIIYQDKSTNIKC